MAVLKTALVLVHVLVVTLAWENIPSIPANRRAQYYLQHDDGAYKFGYDTGEGHSGKASADAANQVQGEYSYVDGAGQRVNWQYTAGDGGYVPVMSGSAGGGAVAKTSGFSSRAHTVQHAGVIPAAPEDADYDENADGSYSFNIDTDSYKRTETSDPKGNIQGQYSYNSPVGGSHAISYIAGEGTGFVVTSDASSAPAASGYSYPAPGQGYQPPAAASAAAYDGQTQVAPDGSFAFSYSTGDHSHQAVADAQNNVRGSYSFVSHDDGKTRKIDYHAGSATGYVATGDHLPVAPVAGASPVGASPVISAKSYSPPASASPRIGESSDAQTNINPDGSFSYSYTTGDHSKHETADANNNVRGSFTFKAKDDGKTRKVDYIAGADTGFVASGDHLPVAPSPAGPGFKSASSHASTSLQSSHSFSGASASSSASSVSDSNADGSYSFSYDTGDHSHAANADAQGNVAGSFSFVAKDGVSRTVDYTAGADKGFIAKGAHLPVAPASPGHATAASPSTGGGYQYSAPSSSVFSSDDQGNSDGSYSYSYDAGTSSKQEAADAQGNVRGSFSFIGGDGVNRKLTYTARGEEGFLAQGDHLPVAPEPGLAAPNAFAHAGLHAGSSAAAKSHASASSTGSVMASKEGEYSYSYKTGGQSSSGASFKTSASQNGFAAAAKPYSAASASQGAATGHVKASKDGAYSYSYATGGQSAAASKAASGHGSAASSYSAPASSAAHGSVTGHVKASKDGAYSYSYSTGGADAASSKAASGHGAAGAQSYSGAGALSSGSQADDGSYSFAYDAGTHSHEQSADASNNVRGSFSFKAKDDGQLRKVEYTAGSATGFLAKGAHLPVAPVAGGAAPAPISASRLAASSGYNAASSGYNAASSGYDAAADSGDGSYSYSYDAGTSSKQESADAKGNVVGTFSFVGGDGVSRKLSYTAKNEEGFNAVGDHLPVAPVIGGGSSSSSSLFKSSSASSSSSTSSSSSSHRFSSNVPASTSILSRSDGNAVISRYLPPESPHKFGYIYDTKA